MEQNTKKETMEALLDLFLSILEKRTDRNIDRIKGWVKQYDEDSPLDKLIAIVVQEAIGRIGQAVQKDIKKRGEMTGRRAVELAVKNLRIMADGYEKQLGEGESFSGVFDFDDDKKED